MVALTIRAPVALGAGVRPLAAKPRSRSAAVSIRSTGSKRCVSTVRSAIAMPAPGVPEPAPMQYNETGKWRENFDLAAWGAEVRALEKELKEGQSEEDVKHLNKILTWANCCYFGGLAALFAFQIPALGYCNPLAALMMSTAICARWTMVGHHVCHGGYNSLQSENGEVTGRFHRRAFARGLWRRCTDWMDWMLPEAWDVEHNHLHHYQLGEKADPDLVERNMKPLREGTLPMFLRYGQVIGLAMIWKWFYYAPNTLKEMWQREQDTAERRGTASKATENPFATGELPSTVATVSVDAITKGKWRGLWEMLKCFAPYSLFSFVALPAVGYAVGGQQMAVGVLLTSILADVMTNIHSFIIIATNHVGDDIYRFESETKPRTDDFYLRAVIGSANFKTGGDVNDFWHGWLNYQIEHHMFPDISMLSYQKAQPRVKAICEKYGVPYVQESVFKRVGQLSDVMVGKKSMLVWERGD